MWYQSLPIQSFGTAFLQGMAMSYDLAGSRLWQAMPAASEIDLIGEDFRAVGDDIRLALASEGPNLQVEVKEREAQQLKLALTGV